MEEQTERRLMLHYWYVDDFEAPSSRVEPFIVKRKGEKWDESLLC